MPIGPSRPEFPKRRPGAPRASIQQVSWNGRVMLDDLSDDAYKRVLARLLGYRLAPLQVPGWDELLESLRPITPAERRALLVRAIHEWADRRIRFLSWWLEDTSLGGSAVALYLGVAEMVAEIAATEERLLEWDLVADVTPEVSA